jgi:hypothetical protein
MHIHRLTEEYSELYSSVPSTFLSLGTEEFSSVILLGTEEYKKTEEDTMFSYSDILEQCYEGECPEHQGQHIADLIVALRVLDVANGECTLIHIQK